MAWTDKQTKAIYTRGSNIIVSAGAGSGKTAVLSERILEYVKAGNSVRDLIVLTFTNAAASEMRGRIYKKLLDNNLNEEANLVNTAYISTFDSLSLNLVKKFYYLLGINPDVKVLDNAISKALIDEILNKQFDEYFLTQNEGFLTFLDLHNQKNENNLKEIIKSLYYTIDKKIDGVKYLEDYPSNFYREENINLIVEDYLNLLDEEVFKVNKLFYDLIDMLSTRGYDTSKYDEIISFINQTTKDYNYFLSYKDISLPRLPSKCPEDIKNIKEELKKQLDEFKERLIYSDVDAMYQELYSMKSDIIFVTEACISLIQNLELVKQEYNSFTFNDIAKMAIDLVTNYQEVKNYLANIKEILVDEYQDTSDLQEEFLNQIANNNLYMVGDIKQSIYRFRNANPYLFKNKYDKYSENNGGIKIDLLHNFRSRSEVLADINYIFNQIMTDSYGDADYKKSHQMVFGLKAYEEAKGDYQYQTEIVVHDELASEDEESKLNNYEREAYIAAKEIKNIIQNGLVMANGTVRKANYSDICILVEKATSFDLLKKILEANEIPVRDESNIALKNSRYVKSIVSLLGLTANIKDNNYDVDFKRNLVAVLRSFIYEYTDEEIYKILHPDLTDISIYDYYNELEVVKIIKGILKKGLISPTIIFDELLKQFKIYEKIDLIGNAKGVIVENKVIFNLLSGYNQLGYDFNKTLELLVIALDADKDVTYKQVGSANNEVRLMTIHKSKGLEFPFVIMPFLSSKFNLDSTKSANGFDDNYGIYLKPIVGDGSTSMIRSLHVKKEKQLLISEKIRLLYVAFTRAREKLILIMPNSDNKPLRISDCDSFSKMLYLVDGINRYFRNEDLADFKLVDYKKTKTIKTILRPTQVELAYNEADYLSNPLEKGHISKTINQIISEEERYILDLGTRLHAILETIDFNNPDLTDLDIKEKEIISSILDLEVFKQINLVKDYREHAFYFEENGVSYSGIIDLLLEYSDHFEIIDYKLSDLDKSEYIEQLGVYYRYLKRITSKPIKVYLLSILNKNIKEIKYEQL